jgi:hypothetical protein
VCDDATFALFKQLSTIPMQDLSLDSVMFLTSHDKCCGERKRKESKRQLFLSRVRKAGEQVADVEPGA